MAKTRHYRTRGSAGTRAPHAIVATLVLLRNFVFSAGKTFTQPLFVLLVAAIFLTVLSIRRSRGPRSPLLALLAVLGVLWLLSTSLVAEAMTSAIALHSHPAEPPDVIEVLGGGSLYSDDPMLEALSYDSSLRVSAAVSVWRQHPGTPVIVAGGDTRPEGNPTRTAELMRDRAVQLGVPPALITLETRSHDTREHPIYLRELSGITRATRVGVVTSSWHMRRALREFRRHFDVVLPYSLEYPSHPLNLNSLIPDAQALRQSTTIVHECIGIAWYALRDALDDLRGRRAAAPRLQRRAE